MIRFCYLLLSLLFSLSCFSQKGKWRKTVNTNTISCYLEFMNKYPYSDYYDSACLRIVEADYMKAKEMNTIPGYKIFLDNYAWKDPDGYFLIRYNKNDTIRYLPTKIDFNNVKWIGAGHEELSELEYERIIKTNSIDDYRYFVNSFKESKHISEVTRRLLKLEYDQAIRLNTLDGYRFYLEKYGNDYLTDLNFNELIYKSSSCREIIPDATEFAKQISSLLPEMEFNYAEGQHTVSAYNNFLAKYPDSKYSFILQAELEKVNFDEAVKYDNVTDYKKFLERYPNSKYKSEVLSKFAMVVLDGEVSVTKPARDRWVYQFRFKELQGVGVVLNKEHIEIKKANGVVMGQYSTTGEKYILDIKAITINPKGTTIHESWIGGAEFQGGTMFITFYGHDVKGNPITIDASFYLR